MTAIISSKSGTRCSNETNFCVASYHPFDPCKYYYLIVNNTQSTQEKYSLSIKHENRDYLDQIKIFESMEEAQQFIDESYFHPIAKPFSFLCYEEVWWEKQILKSTKVFRQIAKNGAFVGTKGKLVYNRHLYEIMKIGSKHYHANFNRKFKPQNHNEWLSSMPELELKPKSIS